MENFELIHIILGGYTITEPVTAATNVVLSLLCFSLSIKLQKNLYFKRNLEFKFWRNFFFFMGISTFLGVFSHGARHYLNMNQYTLLWLVMQSFSGYAMFFAEKATLKRYFNQLTFNKINPLLQLKFVIFIIAAFYYKDFMSVVVNSAVGFISILIVNIHFLKKGRKTAIKMIIGILLGIIAALFHVFKIGYNEWFNHNDLNHVIIALSLYVIYQFSKTVRVVENI